MTSVQAYNITIGEQSAVYEYNPHRDIDLATGWNDSYTGSAIYVYGGLGTGTPYRATQYSGANAILTFQGTAVYMCFTPGSNVEWSFSLNPTAAYRQLDGSADPTCSQWGGTTLVVADSLTYNSYTATLTVNSIPPGGQFAFFGSVVSVSIGPVGTKANPPLTIDDHASTWTYTPVNEWDQETDTGAVDGEYSQTCYYNGQNIASASYTATNTSALYVVGMLRADIAFYTVQLNGEPPLKYNAFNFWTTNQQVLFFAGGLDPTQEYTVQLQNYDTDYTTPPIPANCLRIDAIYLINGSPPPGYVSPPCPLACLMLITCDLQYFLHFVAASLFQYFRAHFSKQRLLTPND
ncbi:hypothetical protein CALCODRAFT_378987 [Calocera cornea HHB12733]|uniref:Uncharacterized protein n=1 Tax=Calocera cornea HHB12733 TaxID=1353952 RepID=A0A165EDH7_9BASI|nr:hypothetical protein CALCODRAFT_378987 [Calocera cornea HHB12733]